MIFFDFMINVRAPGVYEKPNGCQIGKLMQDEGIIRELTSTPCKARGGVKYSAYGTRARVFPVSVWKR
jgi:hypothetical protein